MGLIPLFADPRKFSFPPPGKSTPLSATPPLVVEPFSIVEPNSPFPELTSHQMLEFKLKVKCTRNTKAPQDSEDPNELYQSHKGRCGDGCGLHLVIVSHI